MVGLGGLGEGGKGGVGCGCGGYGDRDEGVVLGAVSVLCGRGVV